VVHVGGEAETGATGFEGALGKNLAVARHNLEQLGEHGKVGMAPTRVVLLWIIVRRSSVAVV
jgi:hypothetical protein